MDPQQFLQNLESAASSPVDAAQEMATEAPAPVADPNVPFAAGEPESVPESATVDYEARAREAEERARQIEAEASRYKSTLDQVNQWAMNYQMQQQAQAEQQRYRQWRDEALDAAESMAPQDARRYLAAEFQKIEAEKDRMYQMQMQQLNQQREQERRVLGKPIFIEQIVRDNGLSDDDRKFLDALENPDDAARIAPMLKQNRERWNAQQEQINQIVRAQQAGQLQAAGIGTVGGTVAPGSAPTMPEDPDEKAIWLLHNAPAR